MNKRRQPRAVVSVRRTSPRQRPRVPQSGVQAGARTPRSRTSPTITETTPTTVPNSRSDRKGFFRQNDQRQRRDPDKVHHAEDEQQRHQRSAAGQTGHSMDKAKPRGARTARPPKPDQKRHRRSAGIETGSLERRRLIKASGNQESAANALIAEREGHFRNRAGAHEQPLGQSSQRREIPPRQPGTLPRKSTSARRPPLSPGRRVRDGCRKGSSARQRGASWRPSSGAT